MPATHRKEQPMTHLQAGVQIVALCVIAACQLYRAVET